MLKEWLYTIVIENDPGVLVDQDDKVRREKTLQARDESERKQWNAKPMDCNAYYPEVPDPLSARTLVGNRPRLLCAYHKPVLKAVKGLPPSKQYASKETPTNEFGQFRGEVMAIKEPLGSQLKKKIT